MIKIFEVQQQVNNVLNYQSRVVEFDSFEEYLRNINEMSLPPKSNRIVYTKHVNHEKGVITFLFEHQLGGRWIEFTHFAQVIGEVI